MFFLSANIYNFVICGKFFRKKNKKRTKKVHKMLHFAMFYYPQRRYLPRKEGQKGLRAVL